MAHSKGSEQTIRGRERELAALALRKEGLTYAEIAERLGISESGAHAAVMRALRRLFEKVNEEAEQVRTLELQRLDDLLMALWPKRHLPHYVDRILHIMERRSKLLGLDAPSKVALDGSIGVRREPTDLSQLSEEDIAQLEAILARAADVSRGAGGEGQAET